MTTTDWTTPPLAAIDAALGKFPPHLLAAYRQQWAPADAALQIWRAVGASAS